MTAENWDRIKLVFSSALGMPASERDTYIARECDGREDLRAAVLNLLSAHDDAASSFLEPGTFVFDAPRLFRTGDIVAGRFRVTRPIARGAMGEVYEVYDDRLRLRVALKAIRPQLIGDRQTGDRFRREVQVTRDIAHPGLCRVFDLAEHQVGPGAALPEGAIVPCLTMQLLEGTSLDEWLRTIKPLPAADALPLVIQIAEALDVLHDHGVVHRDLKPSNVMLVWHDGQPRAVLTDFGLAKPLDESLFETQVTVFGGAPFFMAPELFRGERPGRASDLYAFGLLIDEMVTSSRAFVAETLHGLILEKLEGEPRAPSCRATDLPASWDAAILRCLARNPEDRFRSAHEVCAALTGAAPVAARGARPRRARARRWRYAVYAGATAASLSAAAIVGQAVPQNHSVVLRPFDNLTGEAGNEYLATGTAGELRRRLSRVPGLHVYAAPENSAAVRTADATFALRGYVQQAGSTLRVTAELTSVSDGTLLWSQSFEGLREGALELEDRMAIEAVHALTRATYARARDGPVHSIAWFVSRWWQGIGRAPVPGGGTRDNAAFDAYLRGRYLFEERTLSAALAAIEYLRHATELDPNYAAPHAALADVQSVLMDLHYAPHDQLLAEAERHATMAIALDPDLPEALVSLAAVRQMQSRWTEAEDAYRRALVVHSRFARAHRWFGGMLLQFGRFDESLRMFSTALELDPYDYPSHSAYGLALFYARKPYDAAAQLEHLLDRKDFLHAHLILGQVYAFLAGADVPNRRENLGKALHESERLREWETRPGQSVGQPPRTEYADFVAALAWGYQSDPQAAQPFVARLEAGLQDRQVSPSILARVYAVHRRTEDALDALEAAAAQNDRNLLYLSVSPHYDHIRDEPRFRQLLRRVRLIN